MYHLACLQLTVFIGGCGEDALAVAILEAMVKPVSKIEPRPRRFMPPPAIPDDVDDPAVRKASGVIKLPHHVRWSGPDRTYNLNDRRDRARVYEQVLQEGLEEDVRYLIDIDKLVELWDELFLPAHVRQAWADWLAAHRGISL